MLENCWLIHGEEPAGTSNRLTSRTPASTGKVAVLEYGAGGYSHTFCLPAKVPLLRLSEAYCVDFLPGSWRSGLLEVGLEVTGYSWGKGILWEEVKLHSD